LSEPLSIGQQAVDRDKIQLFSGQRVRCAHEVPRWALVDKEILTILVPVFSAHYMDVLLRLADVFVRMTPSPTG
jgi:hypothetical protein